MASRGTINPASVSTNSGVWNRNRSRPNAYPAIAEVTTVPTVVTPVTTTLLRNHRGSGSRGVR